MSFLLRHLREPCFRVAPTSGSPPRAPPPPPSTRRPLPQVHLGMASRCVDRRAMEIACNASSSTADTESSDLEDVTEKSEEYSTNMTSAMGAVLTYRHELGMNYNFILPDLIVGSCLQTPLDVDKLRKIGVKTIFCLQQNSDLEYFAVDIAAIQDYCVECADIEHCRAEIRDFDAFDLRMRLPAVVSKLHKVIKRNGGVTYVHCTAGLGRAPAVAVSYMFWILGYGLLEANTSLLSKRACFPKLQAIRSATGDILTGISKSHVTFKWKNGDPSLVEISGLDIGWGQRMPLTYDRKQGLWILERDLPEGHYEYKYVVDGEWTCNTDEKMTELNGDGHVNNYINVLGKASSGEDREVRDRLAGEDDPYLTKQERLMIHEFLEQYVHG